MLRKPWAWQKRVCQNLELHLDAAIDKVENPSFDVRNQSYEEVKKIADRDEKKVVAEKKKDQIDGYTTTMITPIMGVAEGSISMVLMLLKSSWQSRAIRIRVRFL